VRTLDEPFQNCQNVVVNSLNDDDLANGRMIMISFHDEKSKAFDLDNVDGLSRNYSKEPKIVNSLLSKGRNSVVDDDLAEGWIPTKHFLWDGKLKQAMSLARDDVIVGVNVAKKPIDDRQDKTIPNGWKLSDTEHENVKEKSPHKKSFLACLLILFISCLKGMNSYLNPLFSANLPNIPHAKSSNERSYFWCKMFHSNDDFIQRNFIFDADGFEIPNVSSYWKLIKLAKSKNLCQS